MITIYHNPRCRKSRETLEIIEQKGAMVEVVEYLKMPPGKDDLKHIIDKLGIRPEELVRKGEPVFKEKYKGKTLSDEEWIEAMEEYPILIERPIVVKGNKAVIGRPPEKVLGLLKED